jgi:hypothetical protein
VDDAADLAFVISSAENYMVATDTRLGARTLAAQHNTLLAQSLLGVTGVTARCREFGKTA